MRYNHVFIISEVKVASHSASCAHCSEAISKPLVFISTVAWEKFGVKNFRLTPRMTKIKHMKILLLQRNRVVYNGL